MPHVPNITLDEPLRVVAIGSGVVAGEADGVGAAARVVSVFGRIAKRLAPGVSGGQRKAVRETARIVLAQREKDRLCETVFLILRNPLLTRLQLGIIITEVARRAWLQHSRTGAISARSSAGPGRT